MDKTRLNEPRVRDYIVPEKFEEILAMEDDDDEESFTQFTLSNFDEQFEKSVNQIEQAVVAKDIEEVLSAALLMKKSSDSLGFWRIKDCFEKMFNLGRQMDESGQVPTGDLADNFKRTSKQLVLVKQAFAETKEALKYLGL